MSRKKPTMEYRRKREGKTDYKARLRILASKKPRMVVRRSLKNTLIQIVEYDERGDRIVASARTTELSKYGWKGGTSNTPAAYLCGLVLGKKALAKKITEAIADIGQHSSVKGGVLYAAIKGAIDAGMKINCAKEMFPSEERITGEHIEKYAKKIKENTSAYERQFGDYIKRGLLPEQLSHHFKEVKTKIIGAK